MANSKRFDELVAKFKEKFPDWVPNIREFKPFQRDVIILITESGRSLIFMYKNQNDWTFGTKLYRTKPMKKKEEKKDEETEKCDSDGEFV